MLTTLESKPQVQSVESDTFSLYLDNDAIQTQLFQSALVIQSNLAFEQGTEYRREDIQKALITWLELSIESLVEDAVFHCTDSNSTHAYNRRAFELALKKVRPIA
jgi:hypothetical protein